MKILEFHTADDVIEMVGDDGLEYQVPRARFENLNLEAAEDRLIERARTRELPTIREARRRAAAFRMPDRIKRRRDDRAAIIRGRAP